MKFHFHAGELNQDAPEVWGVPTLSKVGAGWLINWHDRIGSIHGVTVAKGPVLEWIKANPEAVKDQNEKLTSWLKTK